MRSKKRKIIRVALVLVMLFQLVCTGYWAKEIFTLSSERKLLKEDYSYLNSIKYGLLSVDRWRDNIAQLVAEQIDRFKLSGRQEKDLKDSLNEIINSLITKAVEIVNEKQKGLGNKLKQMAFNSFVDVDKIRARVPEFSQTIIDEIKNPKNKRRLKFLANDKLEEMAQATKDNMIEMKEYEIIMGRYSSHSLADVNQEISERGHALQTRIYEDSTFLVGMVFVFLLIFLLVRKYREFYKPVFFLSVILALILLLVGIGSPMIEIDARIKEVSFLLLNKNILFNDQVIFYQSKSILDVVHILISTHKADSVFVGLLILMFSVMFPVCKLLSTEIVLLGKEKWKKNSIINFFAFKSGKWSMADVMVVAIFMAYVGFNGILDNQLQILNVKAHSFESIATNKTSLQPGFILFITFVLYGLLLSEILKRITARYSKESK